MLGSFRCSERSVPAFSWLFNSLGVVYFHQGLTRKAENSFLQTTHFNSPSNNALDVAWSNLGSLYEKRGEYSKAEEAYRRSLEVTEGGSGILNRT